ncbi:ABC transporter ATP-binding protein [Macrococcoides caseolyticum]|uniref:ribosomal protection-like ABC-F family protein n=1 Tax=Macrococcoides caseolyticum TaxID=69966 RepID=UPI000C34F636|nr:ABC-F type ribosomal protection protein [Macrococcus caseolyticus]PKE34320.1 ABC transporter ATP-binding protein [Macrococcus caseolyticus]PKF30809.1 ABC transporter ATP-binding protein [Macrococcus caseolyticus]TDM17679.1 ABC-F type ribosomal protection protein [Macrococcus caseolyticus]VUC69446.1 ABC transporter ATP-binding protein [Macrococcus caseolyticus]
MNILNVTQVSKSFTGDVIFEDIKFEVNDNDRIGLIGRNGEGKTTLFKLISGEERPDSGFISLSKDIRVGILSQIPKFPDDMDVYSCLAQTFIDLDVIEKKMKALELKMASNPDNLEKILVQYANMQEKFEALGGYEKDSKINFVMHGLKINSLADRLWSQLSGGERTKVGLAMLLLQSPELLLLDEPTNHLDIDSIEWLTQFIKNYKGAVIIISHDRYFLDETVSKILEIDQQALHIYHGNYSYFIKEKEDRILREYEEYKNQQKKIQKMKAQIKQLKIWANQAVPPNAAMHRRAKSMEKALARIEIKKKPIIDAKTMQLDIQSADKSSNDVFTFIDVAKMYDDILFEDVNMKIRRNDRISIVGANGTGKSTLIKMMLEDVFPDEGEIIIAPNIKFGYLSQHHFTEDNDTVLDAYRAYASVTEGEARNHLAGYLFYGYDVFKKVKDLSGGEKMRLRWAQIMSNDFNVLILDEPTNHLDIESKEILEDALDKFEGTIIAVSHDRYFLDKFFDVTYWIEDKNVNMYLGNYSCAKQKKAE